LTGVFPWFTVAHLFAENFLAMSAKKSTPIQAFNFEASLSQLEKLVTRMESGELGLEESLKAFEEGVKLTRQCQETLNAAQQKVQLLMEKNGKSRLQDADFDNED
jgi:exodeoxyribonuclease VII small subunit